jgi:NAD(P)-dependent dehydrogenase (short-subunit alcohol dehydrogenase family)
VDLGLEGANAVVAGGSKGMGRAVAEILAADGANVAVMARGKGALDETVEVLGAAGSPDAVGISVDMSDPDSIASGYAEVEKRWGSLNILVHTIGPRDGTFDALDDQGWADAITLGTMSAVRNVRAALPLLRAAEWGRIAIFSAHSIQRQSPRLVAYTASKAAVTSLAKNLAKTLAPEGILVNTVCPGTIVTASFTDNLKPVFAAENLDPTDPHDVMRWIDKVFHQPADLGRAGLPDEVASLTAYLVSRRNGYVTGACVNADGGSDFV